MLTPEQIAAEIVERHMVKTLAPIADPLALKRLIAGAIRAERERAEHIANSEAQRYSARNAVDGETLDFLTGAETTARHIAALIRSS